MCAVRVLHQMRYGIRRSLPAWDIFALDIFTGISPMTTTPAKLEIRKSRSFGDMINLIFAFVRENYKKLGKSLLYIVGIPALLAGALIGQAYGEMFASMGDPEAFTETLLQTGGIRIAIGGLAATVASLFLIGLVNNYVFLYMDRGYDGFEVSDVWQATRSSLGRIFVTILGMSLIFAVFALLWVGATLISEILGVLIILLSIVPLVYCYITFSFLFTVRLREDVGVFESISRCVKLVKGNWWQTAGIAIVILFIGNFVSSLFIMPVWIIMVVVAATSGGNLDEVVQSGGLGVLIMALMMIALTLNYLIAALPMLANVLQYFNLVEKSEGVGLLERIEQIGNEGESSGTAF